jgi:tRNA-binding protein
MNESCNHPLSSVPLNMHINHDHQSPVMPTIGLKKSSAQITQQYQPEESIGKQVAAVVNFSPSQVGNLMSEVLTLGFSDENNQVVLFSPDESLPNGARLH